MSRYPARRPTWRKAGRDAGFRIVGRCGQWDLRRVSRHVGQVWVPKTGWVRFRWSRSVSAAAKSYRVTMDRSGRWYVTFAVIPAPGPAPGNDQAVGIDRGVALSAALSTGELLHTPRFDVIGVENLKIGNMTRSAKGTRENPGRVERVSPAFTSQRCSACGRADRDSRERQAIIRCTACGFACNADGKAAINIAAGHAVTARGGDGITRPVNREPQLLLPLA